MLQFCIILLIGVCLIRLQYGYLYSTNILWGNYKRPPWAGSLNFNIDRFSGQITQVFGYVVPISSRGRGNIPLSYNAHYAPNRERGYLLSLSNGGPDIEYNVISQPNKWQINGGWARLQATIHNFTVLTYNWNACMCHGAYTVHTVFNASKPEFRVYVAININDYDKHGYPWHYYGFVNPNGTIKYAFNITENETATWHPKPPSVVPHCPESSRCCYRWNCCQQKQIEQVFTMDANVSSTTFYEGDYIESNNGLYHMILEDTGNFSIYNKSGNPIWESNSGNGIEDHPYKLQLLSNGSMQLQNNKSNTIWQTKGCDNLLKPFRFIMEDDGNLVLYSFGNIPCWSSNTSMSLSFDNKKSFICSSNLLVNEGVDNTSYFLSNDSCIAEVLMNGQFVIKDLQKNSKNNIVWYTNTTNIAQPPYRLSLQMDGRLVLSGNNNFMWGVNTYVAVNVSTMQNFMLTLQRENTKCLLTLHSNNMSIIWSSL